ncbi:MAG: 30S ribosomal protein S4 [Candidatus Colwellbacteria bacterium]|nr:30S ribosomal protein S4 [Candidatus Colwellbacteria bacterium]
MQKILEKKERSLGVKLSIKGDRCGSPKCALIRKPYRPGQHGKSHRRKVSEFGKQLQEKQKVRFTYGLSEKQLGKVFSEAERKAEVTSQGVIEILESRLDNVIFRLGFVSSRSAARQLVGHGHFSVHGRKVTIPSRRMKIGDKVSIRPESKNAAVFQDLKDKLKNYEVPTWLSFDKEKLEGEIVAKPHDVIAPFDINAVVDYYS